MAADCRQLISTLLSPLQLHFRDLFWDQALECWHKESSEPPPSDDTFHIQKAWDTPIVSSNFDSLLSSFTDPVDKARVLAVSSKESGTWLYALPIASAGLKLEDVTVRIGVGLRLGIPLVHPHICSNCHASVEAHGLSCHYSKGRFLPHSIVNSIIKRSLDALNFSCRLEPIGISRTDGKRPDGITLAHWKHGKALIWDFTYQIL